MKNLRNCLSLKQDVKFFFDAIQITIRERPNGSKINWQDVATYLNVKRVNNVVDYELKIRMSEPVFNIPLPAREVVVCDDDLMTFKH